MKAVYVLLGAAVALFFRSLLDEPHPHRPPRRRRPHETDKSAVKEVTGPVGEV